MDSLKDLPEKSIQIIYGAERGDWLVICIVVKKTNYKAVVGEQST